MKLLFDQNLSPRLVTKLADHYPASAHVVTHALDHALDEAVWTFAREHGYTLVTNLEVTPPGLLTRIYKASRRCCRVRIKAALTIEAAAPRSLGKSVVTC
jgi:hypothetical protein